MTTLNKFFKEKNITPLYMYDNLNKIETKNSIRKDLKDTAGIYMILNNINMDFYIGSASTNRLYGRLMNHLFYFNGSKTLKHAVNKYGIENFSFIILEIYPDIINKDNNKKLMNIEDFYLKSLLPNYNILTEAGSSFGYKHTEVSRIKMRSAYSERRRKLISGLNRGGNLLSEVKHKFNQIASNKEIMYSDKVISNTDMDNKCVAIYNLDNTMYGEYDSISEAASDISCSSKTIYRALKTEKSILKRKFRVYIKNI